MSRKSNRAALRLTNEEREKLIYLSQSRKVPFREKQRAQTLLKYSEKMSISDIEKKVHVSRPSIYKCIDKALAAGIDAGLKDTWHRPKPPTITDDAKAWVINIACTKPNDHGYAAEIWSRSLLAKHARKFGPSLGYECLANAVKATVHRILRSHPIRPDKIAYYNERRDPEFEKKMNEVLIVYKEVAIQNQVHQAVEYPEVITISVDEKPGVQAIEGLAPDLLPNPNKNSRLMRDNQYKRHGTVSILAALDLHTGHVISQVHDRHRSCEFISLLKEIDAYYPEDRLIRIILDNHSAHISKETMNFLKTCPNRFQYVHTPKHGSWLNIVETLFGKMARTFLKRIRVQSKDELKMRIRKGIDEINESPVIFKWKKFDIKPQY